MERVVEQTQRALIEDFLNDYAYKIDDGDYEAWPNFFTEDAFYQVITKESYEAGLPVGILTCDGRGMMVDRTRALRDANIYEPHSYSHFLSRPALEEREGGAITARTNFQVIRTMQNGDQFLYGVGKYLDEIVWEDGMPKLRKRMVILESRRVDILLVLPL